MNFEKAKSIRKILLVVACITFIVGLVLSIQRGKERSHDPEKIKIEVLSCESKYDEKNYYVYLDYKIDNNTKATIDYIELTTYFSDKNGKLIGTMTSTYGQSYSWGTGVLNLKPLESVIRETYLSEWKSSSSYGKLFTYLYNNGIKDLVITYEITSVNWSDNYRYSR